MSKKKLVWIWSSVAVGLIIILTIVYQVGHNATTGSDEISSSTDNQVAGATDQSGKAISYNKTALADLVNVSNDNGADFIDTTGTVQQKIKTTDASDHIYFYLKLSDGNSGIALVQFKEDVLNNYKIGDVVEVKGLAAPSETSNPFCGTSVSASKLCSALGIPQNKSIGFVIPMLIENDVAAPDTQAVKVIQKATKNVQSNNSVGQVDVSIPKPAQPASPSLGISYTTAVAGLNKYFDIQKFTNSNHTGYSGKSPVDAGVTFFLADNEVDISSASLNIMEPNMGYDPKLVTFPADWTQERAISNQIVSRFISNVLPNWASALPWIGNSIQSCKGNGQTVKTTVGSINVTLSCSSTLGMYAIGVGQN